MRTTIQSAFFVLTLIYSESILANFDAPTFKDCQATVTTSRKIANLKLTTHESRQYASILRHLADKPVNFAGHYILALWGCGAGCVMGGAIDIKSGNVAMLPFTVTNWPLDIMIPLSFKKDSCLLVVQGSRNEKGQGIYYYKFERNRFNLIKSVDE
ncbi:MAG: hypothetical protein LBQ32_05995 [Burkholderiaceae bacterium]|nr:hypothetical protein [Burkholderiaceae bacterium]